jgi:hypothetical protein
MYGHIVCVVVSYWPYRLWANNEIGECFASNFSRAKTVTQPPVQPKKVEQKKVVVEVSTGVYKKENLMELWFKENVASQVIESCKTARNHTHCVESFVWVSNSESSMFKACSKSNCMGLMGRDWKIMRYNSLEDKVKDRVRRYNKYWYNHKITKNRLTKSRYCTSECLYRVPNFDNAVKKLRATNQ